MSLIPPFATRGESEEDADELMLAGSLMLTLDSTPAVSFSLHPAPARSIVAVTYVLVSGHYTIEEQDEILEEDENLDMPSDLSDFSSDDDSPPFDGVIRPRPKLSGGPAKTSTSSASSFKSGSSTSSNAAASASSISDDTPTRHIILHLHPSDVAQILDAAATPETQQSWLEGRGRSAVNRRFWLRYSEAGNAAAAECESESGVGVERPSESSHSVIWEKLFEEGRQWWGGDVGEMG